jgi:hypothetical protein
MTIHALETVQFLRENESVFRNNNIVENPGIRIIYNINVNASASSCQWQGAIKPTVLYVINGKTYSTKLLSELNENLRGVKNGERIKRTQDILLCI